MSDDFNSELKHLLNKYSRENASDSPDFILASYLCQCLDAFNLASRSREDWNTLKCTGVAPQELSIYLKHLAW